jgi:hypothetical protein
MGAIKVLTGFSGPGGSTIALSTLVNLFNESGLEACLYGPSNWNGINCKFSNLNQQIKIDPDDIVIYHFLPVKNRLPCKRQILSCHETVVFPIKQMQGIVYDKIHFVSEFQKFYQGVAGTIIPNPIRKFTKTKKDFKVAGIIGSIDPNKRVEESIVRAKADGFLDIRLYGNLTDAPYFQTKVLPLLSDQVTYRGVAVDMDKVYSQISHVYHSPMLETFNLIKPECIAAGVEYNGKEGNDTKAEYWDNKKILESWKTLLFT